MAPDQTAAVAGLARLRAELEVDRIALDRCVADASSVFERLAPGPADRRDLALAAVALHGWYTGLETALERVARALDRTVPAGETWHRDLLSQAMTEVPGVRPAVLPRSLQSELTALLEFRHFFRHAYGIDFEAGRLAENVIRLLALAPAVADALRALDEFLAAALTAASAS